MPNGVICGGAVDGSNQLGAIVIGQAITASPAGGVWPVTSRAAPSVSTTGTSSDTRRLASRFFTVASIPFSLGSVAPERELCVFSAFAHGASPARRVTTKLKHGHLDWGGGGSLAER